MHGLDILGSISCKLHTNTRSYCSCLKSFIPIPGDPVTGIPSNFLHPSYPHPKPDHDHTHMPGTAYAHPQPVHKHAYLHLVQVTWYTCVCFTKRSKAFPSLMHTPLATTIHSSQSPQCPCALPCQHPPGSSPLLGTSVAAGVVQSPGMLGRHLGSVQSRNHSAARGLPAGELSPCRINNGGCQDLCLLTHQGHVNCSCRGGRILQEDLTCRGEEASWSRGRGC